MTLTDPLVLALLAVTAVFLAWSMWTTHRQPRAGSGVRHMAAPREARPFSRKTAVKVAKRLDAPTPGLTIGHAVRGGRELMQNWDRPGSVDVGGPGTGKSTSRVIPVVIEAPGAVVSTSNKRDVLDVTRGPRSEVGAVWVFDPQGIVGEPPAFWWNPLRGVVDKATASRLAGVFTAAVTSKDAARNAYFDGKQHDVVTGLLLAAALDQRTIDVTHRWVTDHRAAGEAVRVLRAHAHEGVANSLHHVLLLADKQRDGVLGSAERVLEFLTHREALRWVTPGEGRPEFLPAEFAASTDTVYLLSREGAGNAGSLVAGLTSQIAAAAEDLAVRSGGRLRVPLVFALDEAANVCRWPELPDLISHYGSCGIALLVWLQSWSQGCEVWGRDGMSKLWSAATVKLYGGGVAERAFLEDLSVLIGEYDRPTTTTSRGRHGRTTNRATQRARILPVDELRALPPYRAVMLGSGTPAVLVRTTPWMKGPHARKLRAHLAKGSSS